MAGFSLVISSGIRRMNTPGYRLWLSIGGLAAAGSVVVLVLIWTFSAALSLGSATCHNAPLRQTQLPQLVGVGVALAGFLLGRVTARPKVDRRSEIRSWAPAEDNRNRAAAALATQAALVAALLFFGVLMAFETVTLASHVWPITYYLRCASEAAPYRTLVAAFAFCFLAGRWLWLPSTAEEGGGESA